MLAVVTPDMLVSARYESLSWVAAEESKSVTGKRLKNVIRYCI